MREACSAPAGGSRDIVWLVPPKSLPTWTQALAAAGWRAHRLGWVEGLAAFTSSPPEGR